MLVVFHIKSIRLLPSTYVEVRQKQAELTRSQMHKSVNKIQTALHVAATNNSNEKFCHK